MTDKMSTKYFTFGSGHAHSVNGFTFDKDVVVKITAEDPRAVMVDYFGTKWSMEYEKAPMPEFFPRGVKELPHAT